MNSEIPQKFLHILEELHTDENPHSNRSLLNHLRGTYLLLKTWDNSEAICLAGLFHSIYGTQFYKISSTSLENRSYIKELIGEFSEVLAYLFCVTDRNGFFRCIEDGNHVLNDLVHNTEVPISYETLKALLEIEMANCLEQLEYLQDYPIEHQKAFQEKMEKARPYLSEKAYDSFKKFFSIAKR